MKDVISKKTNHLNVSEFSSLQTVKFDLQARKVSSISWYRRRNFLRSPFDYKLYKKHAQKRFTRRDCRCCKQSAKKRTK